MATRDEKHIASVAAALPTERAALLDLAAQAIEDLHASVLACDEDGATVARDRYSAIVWKLNGGTLFACMDRCSPEAGGLLAEAHCRAEPGTVPKWGQRGEFLISVQGIRSRVEVSEGFGRFSLHLEFNAVDPHALFISRTGYRSHFENVRFGLTVEEVAKGVFQSLIDAGREPLAPEYRRRRAAEPVPEWLATLPAPAPAECVYQDRAGQMAFGF